MPVSKRRMPARNRAKKKTSRGGNQNVFVRCIATTPDYQQREALAEAAASYARGDEARANSEGLFKITSERTGHVPIPLLAGHVRGFCVVFDVGPIDVTTEFDMEQQVTYFASAIEVVCGCERDDDSYFGSALERMNAAAFSVARLPSSTH